jgi:macrophage erythroblast attacher
MTTSVAPDQALLLEQPLLKVCCSAAELCATADTAQQVPYENLRRTFRSSQKAIEREMTAIQTGAKKVDRNSSHADAELVENMLCRARGLKRKVRARLESRVVRLVIVREELLTSLVMFQLSELNSQSSTTLQATKARLDHLQELYSLPPGTTLLSPQYAAWSRTRLALQLIDYLLRRGYTKSAALLAEEEGVGQLVDLSFWNECTRIEQALASGSASEALAWCRDNQSTLKKMQVSPPVLHPLGYEALWVMFTLLFLD